MRFVLAWHFPVGQVYWRLDGGGEWRNYYASQWADSSAVAVEIFDRWQALRDPTFAFRNALFGSSLPVDIVDAAQRAMGIFHTGTVLTMP
jgi:hypothetical protein